MPSSSFEREVFKLESARSGGGEARVSRKEHVSAGRLVAKSCCRGAVQVHMDKIMDALRHF